MGVRAWALFERPRRVKKGSRWKRSYPDIQFSSLLSAARVYQSYLLTGIFPGEDGDPNKEYKIREVH